MPLGKLLSLSFLSFCYFLLWYLYSGFCDRGDAKFENQENIEFYANPKELRLLGTKGNRSTVLFQNAPQLFRFRQAIEDLIQSIRLGLDKGCLNELFQRIRNNLDQDLTFAGVKALGQFSKLIIMPSQGYLGKW